MQIAEADYNGLLARIKKVEGQSRLRKVVGLLALLTLVLLQAANLRAGQKDQDAPLRARTVEAQTFLLKSAAGTLMGRRRSAKVSPCSNCMIDPEK